MDITLQNGFEISLLSNKAVALVSEFALILYRQQGILIDVSSKDVIIRIFENTASDSDHRLRSICLHIKTELGIGFINEVQYQPFESRCA